ncbi:hypothetical protein [Actinomycetospora succinea]|uniref:hypothetical protein n=1 Tax=Actinomycetospora succinea TaxID=663603 RepID=UPI00105DE20E|nr:hypothetical protein [Actinomycetospora succinea]
MTDGVTDGVGEAPDTAVPVVGWRVWRLGGDRTGPELVSPAVTAGWPARTAMTAACRRGCPSAPAWDCGCGLYATTTLDLLLPSFTDAGAVLGCVALWGRVVEADRGWRAEHAYPLLALAPRPDAVAQALERSLTEQALERYLSRGALRVQRVRLLARLRSSARPDADVVHALGTRYGVPAHLVGGALPSVPDAVVARRAEAVRDEAARGLAARRLGDAHARRRFDRAVEDLVAALGRRADPGSPISA